MTSTTRNITLAAAAIVAAVLAAWVYGAFDPAVDAWFPRCMFKMATGLDCPGCGSQRALHALVSGHPAAAWRYNAAFILSLPLLLLLVVTRIWPGLWPRLTRALGSRAFILTLFFLLVAWTIGRNLPL